MSTCSRNLADAYPLSPMQQGMLFHQLYARQPGVDIEQVIATLPEALEPAELEDAWRRATRRHAILRTAFRWEGLEQPLQEVWSDVEPEITWHDWRDVTPGDRENRWEKLLADERRRGFRLDTAPLWRLAVVRLAAREHRLLLSLHHAMIDGVGLVNLLKETLAVGDDAGQPETPVTPYREYIDWLQTRDRRADERFWRRALQGFTGPTPLPGASEGTDLSEQPSPVPRARETVIPEERTRTLRTFARRNRCTLNTLVLGAWGLLLARYSGEDDVLFGAVRACRKIPVAGVRSMVGPVINTVPLRVSVPAGQPAHEWIGRLREQWKAIQPHEHTPLADIRKWSEVPNGLPLFRSLVNYQEPTWNAALNAQGGAWSRRGFSNRGQPGYPIALEAAGGPTLALKLLYDPLRFEDDTIRRILGHLVTLVEGLANDPESPVDERTLLTDAERTRILVEWNNTRTEYPADRCVHHLVEEQVARTPRAPAVTDDRHKLTYAQLNTLADSLARDLHTLGVGPEVCVAVCLPRSVEFVLAALAVFKAGGAYVPIDPDCPPARLASTVKDAQAAVLLTYRKFTRGVTIPARLIALDSPNEWPHPSEAPRGLPRAPTPRDLAYVIYTSGSTGTPKGVAIEHRSVLNLISWHRRTYTVTPADRATQLANPAFDASVWEIWPYLACGASVHIPSDETRNNPAALIDWLAGRQITLTFLPTPLAEAVLDETWPSDTALRAILTGGDRLQCWPGDRLPCPLVNHYGPTEATVVATCGAVPAEPDSETAPSIGAPIDNTEAYVLDRHRRPVPVGVAGELYVGGTGLARGYYGRPDLTEERFVPHPFEPGARLYRTGDRVIWRTDGQLDFLGRLDDQIKIRGFRIEPGEVEAVLKTHPGVRDSLVMMRKNGGVSRLVAYVVPPAGSPAPETAELRDRACVRLPDYMVPAAVVVLDRWPLTANGKIDRRHLPAPEFARHPEETGSGEKAGPKKPFVAPRGETEETVVRIWTEVLDRDGIGAYDNFFELGGHSLTVAQTISRLNAAFDTNLSVRALFENPTVAALAGVLEQTERGGRARAGPALVRAHRRRPGNGSPRRTEPVHRT